MLSFQLHHLQSQLSMIDRVYCPCVSPLPRYLECAIQHHLHAYHFILYLISTHYTVNFALISDLDLRFIHVDTLHVEEILDTIMALFLSLICHMDLLSYHTLSAFGWLNFV
ncbi:hypothetical protein VNO78_06660 [Psophocarpus tetragonolobus]|uniref:Uncharacterized protein n=1 Tax=Psophocarpus tetragonolobus TaxID=3891 RepID=A0AAN9SVH3_PSOTE